MKFSDLPLNPLLIESLPYDTTTEIQAEVIPAAIEGDDVIVGADTGTGKTLSFLLPVIHHLLEPGRTGSSQSAIDTVILVPTRELAAQVDKDCGFAEGAGLIKTALIVGGRTYDEQKMAINQGAQLLIATPGRLLDLVKNSGLDLSRIKRLVLDEADRLLDMGFKDEISQLNDCFPDTKQTLLFSATLDDSVFNFGRLLRNKTTQTKPKVIEQKQRQATKTEIEQKIYLVDADKKLNVLNHILGKNSERQTLVFVRNRQDADRIEEKLKGAGINCSALHGDKTQKQRETISLRFKEGDLKVLVATDIAARGLHIDDLPCVINYQLPFKPEDYVHRIGRTGRAGKKGLALSLITEQDSILLHDLEELINERLLQQWYPGFEPDLTKPVEVKQSKVKNKRLANKRLNKRGRF